MGDAAAARAIAERGQQPNRVLIAMEKAKAGIGQEVGE